MLGLNMRLVALRDQGRFSPNPGFLPQISHLAMASSLYEAVPYVFRHKNLSALLPKGRTGLHLTIKPRGMQRGGFLSLDSLLK